MRRDVRAAKQDDKRDREPERDIAQALKGATSKEKE